MRARKGISAAVLVVATCASAWACGGTVLVEPNEDAGRPIGTGTVVTGSTTPPPPPAPPTRPDAGPRDGGPLDLDAGPPRDGGPADGGRKDGGATSTCYEPGDAILLPGTPPTASQSHCSDAELAGLRTACLGVASSAAACDAQFAVNPACARCVFGALPGENAATTPIPAIIPTSDDAIAPNIAACAALVIGRPDCAAPLARRVSCTRSACATCVDQAAEDACVASAEAGVCSGTIDIACTNAINAAQATWTPVCRGVTFEESYLKVGRYLCGPALRDR